MAFVVLLVFDLALARFKLVFDLTRRFDEVLDLGALLCLFHDFPRSTSISWDWASILSLASGRDGFSFERHGSETSAT